MEYFLSSFIQICSVSGEPAINQILFPPCCCKKCWLFDDERSPACLVAWRKVFQIMKLPRSLNKISHNFWALVRVILHFFAGISWRQGPTGPERVEKVPVSSEWAWGERQQLWHPVCFWQSADNILVTLKRWCLVFTIENIALWLWSK